MFHYDYLTMNTCSNVISLDLERKYCTAHHRQKGAGTLSEIWF